MKRILTIEFPATLVLLTGFLATGWYFLRMQWRNPLPWFVQSLWGDLISVGLWLEQAMGYYPSPGDPAWWHPTLVIGSAALAWAVCLTLLMSVVWVLWRVIRRVVRQHA